MLGRLAIVTNVSPGKGWVYVRLPDGAITWVRLELLRLETRIPRAWRYSP